MLAEFSFGGFRPNRNLPYLQVTDSAQLNFNIGQSSVGAVDHKKVNNNIKVRDGNGRLDVNRVGAGCKG